MMIRKLYISIVMFGFFIFIATTFTYAWLSMSTTNSVEDLSLITYSDSLLEISLDGENYYNKLPNNILMDLVKNVRFTDLTSFDGKNFSYGVRKKNDKVVINKDYISIDFYFRTVDPFSHLVYLSNNVTNEVNYNDSNVSGTFITSEGRTWASDINFLYGPNEEINKGDAKTYYAKDAIRVSTVERPLNEFDERDNLITKIFDLSEDEERGFGKTYGSYDYYTKKVGELDLPNNIPNTLYQLTEFSEEGPFAYDNNSHILTLIKTDKRGGANNMYYYEGSITLNIWLEGWDADLFDPIFSDHLKIQFEFKLIRNVIERD